MDGIIFDIQRFAVHDGPGIRTTVFLKGCSCRCGWCHNPESMARKPQLEFYPARCVSCGKCFSACPEGAHILAGGDLDAGKGGGAGGGALSGENGGGGARAFAGGGEHTIDREKCTGCGICAVGCYSEALVIKGRRASVEEVMRTVLDDAAYYQNSGGGVTLSGGEPALQSRFAAELLAACKREGLHTNIQTAGNYPFQLLEPLLPLLDMAMYDVKAVTPDIYREHIKGDRELMLGNLARLDGAFAGELIVRTPCVSPVNDGAGEIGLIAERISGLKRLRHYQIMPYHGLGRAKYDALGQLYGDGYATPAAEAIAALEKHAARRVPVFNLEKGYIAPE